MEINNNSSFKTDWDKLRGVIRGGGGGDYRGFAIFVQLYCVCVCVCVMECYTGAFNLTRNDPHRSTTDQPSHRLFSPIHLGRRRRRRLHPTGPKCCRSLIKKKKQTEAARRSRHRSTSSNDLLIRSNIVSYPYRPNSDLNVCLITVTMYSLYIRPLDIKKRGCWNYSHYSKPQYFTRTCDNLSRKCFLLFRLTYRDARPRDDRNRKYPPWWLLPSHAFFTDLPFSIWFFYTSPTKVIFFINKKLKSVNAEWRSCNVWIDREKN